MITVNSPTELRKVARSLKNKYDETIALVPTMGFIHEGHLEVIKLAQQNSDYVIVSIYVNPTQFNVSSDYQQYPKDIERDSELLKNAGVNVLYLPDTPEVYPEGIGNTSTVLSNPNLTKHLCGATRKGHFEGVLLVVSKLLNKIQPDVVVFGEKDYQQYIILKRMVDELLYPTKVMACPIIREENGLAMSSRNARLSSEEREAALLLNKSLKKFQKDFFKYVKAGKWNASSANDSGKENQAKLSKWESKAKDEICKNSLNKIDYIQILDANTLQPITADSKKLICALAVFTGPVRLIDNVVVEVV